MLPFFHATPKPFTVAITNELMEMLDETHGNPGNYLPMHYLAAATLADPSNHKVLLEWFETLREQVEQKYALVVGLGPRTETAGLCRQMKMTIPDHIRDSDLLVRFSCMCRKPVVSA